MRVQPSVFDPEPFPGHELLDSGAGEKLERFGSVVLRRPDPQALWRPRLSPAIWDAAHLSFVRESDRGGRWEVSAGAPRQARGEDASWPCHFGDATFEIRPTPFKHVGLFPEHAANWRCILEHGGRIQGRPPRMLNLFGYTGASSVLAAAAGWEVTHVDASKLAIGWVRDNARASGLGDDALRTICDDALAFAKRDVRRERRYDAVVLDPPHYGRGPKGEVWKLEESLVELLSACRDLMGERALMVLTTYVVGHSPLALQNLVADLAGDTLGDGDLEAGELALTESGERPRRLPAGFCVRWYGGGR